MRLFVGLLFILIVVECSAQDTDTLQKWTFYNGAGIGYDEGTVMATDHVNAAYKRFTFGLFARWSARRDWRTVNFNPYSSYNEFKFVNEFSALAGWRFGRKNQSMFVLMAGPVFRNENARWWPAKGSGSPPFIGTMLDDVDSDDVKSYGGMVTVEWAHTNISRNLGVSVLLFCSIVPEHLGTGITVNFLVGRILPGHI